MGFSWDLANEQAETLKDEITVSAPEALQLVSKILRIPSSRGQYAKQMQYKVQYLNQMIDQQVLDTVKNLNLPDELSLSHRLQRLSDRVKEYKKNQLLKGRAIVGVGALSVQENLLLLILCFIPRCYQKILPLLPLYQLIS